MNPFPTEMESERLRYERLHPESADPYELYQYLHTDAPNVDEITEYVDWQPYRSPKDAVDWIERAGEAFEEGEVATYVLRPKDGDEAGDLAGLAGLEVDWDRQRARLGTWLRKPFWGRGYSGERAGRMLELAFDRLDLSVVVVAHAVDNDKSRRAIRRYVDRFGGREEGRIRNDLVIDGEPRDTIRYSISSAEWAANR